MEVAIVAATIVQAITAVVIAIATIVYTRMSVKMFQAGIEPDISVTLSGSLEANTISVQNDAGCAITDLRVSVSVGATKDGEQFPVRRCIYSYTWPTVGPCTGVESRTPPISRGALFEDADQGSDGVIVNPQDLLVDYSFSRAADSRRYFYRYRVGFVKNPDGRQFYIPLHEPEPLSHDKHIIVKRSKTHKTEAGVG